MSGDHDNSEGLFLQARSMALSGECAALRALVTRRPELLGATDRCGFTLLGTAVGAGAVEIVRMLLEAGANPRRDGEQLLHFAIERPSLEIVLTLLEAGADIEERGMNDWTALHEAAARDCPDIVEALILRGANIEARTRIDFNETPLIEAARSGSVRCVAKLLAHGADPMALDLLGRTAAEYAIDYGYDAVFEHLEPHMRAAE